MKLIFIILGVVCFLVAVKGRHLHDTDSDEEQNAEDSLLDSRNQSPSRSRHRKRPRQSYFDYDNSPYYDNRKENSRQEELYSAILKLLDEMTTFMKRPSTPPAPNPIYIPYPVPYPLPQYSGYEFQNITNNSSASDIRKIGDRSTGGDNNNDSDDGVRPFTFVPILPTETVTEAPSVEHGTVQAGMEATNTASLKSPGVCHAAILTCCNLKTRSERKSCFEKFGCRKTFSTGLSCKPEAIKAVIQEFVKAYTPTNEA